MQEPAPARPFRAGVSRMDRFRQRLWATRVRWTMRLRGTLPPPPAPKARKRRHS